MLLVVSIASARPPDPVEATAKALRRAFRGCVVTHVGERRLVVDCGEDGALSVPLTTLVATCTTGRVACDAARATLVDDLRAARDDTAVAPELVRPVVRARTWADKVDSLVAASGNAGHLVRHDLGGGLVLAWMLDGLQTRRPVLDTELPALGGDEAGLDAIGRANCAGLAAPALTTLSADAVVVDGGEYAACLLYSPPPPLASGPPAWAVWLSARQVAYGHGPVPALPVPAATELETLPPNRFTADGAGGWTAEAP